jgi:hypothetical protein
MRLRYIARAYGQRICLVESDLIAALDEVDPEPPPWKRERKLGRALEAYGDRNPPVRGSRRKSRRR